MSSTLASTFHGQKQVASKEPRLLLQISTIPQNQLLHFSITGATNANVPVSGHLSFAYETSDGGWEPLTKPSWLKRCNEVWIAAGYQPLLSHAFHISSCTEMLLCGINPDIVCVQGRWKSKAFLKYWHKIQSVLPLFISQSFLSARSALLKSSLARFTSKYSL